MTVILDTNIKKGFAARLRQRADELDAADRLERTHAAALEAVKSLAFGMFLAGRHRSRCELNFRAAVQHHKDLIGFKGRFEKGSDEWQAMLAATDPVYRRLEIARHLEKHAKTLLLKAWRDADLKADEADFWGMSGRVPIDVEGFLRDYSAENSLIAANLRDAGLDDEEELSLRRAEANAQAAADLMAEVGITP